MAVGGAALHNVVIGGSNTAVGSAAMLHTDSMANNNVALGRSAGERAKGNHNTYIGANSGFNVRGSTANILIGSVSQASDSIANNQIVIGVNADGVKDNSGVIGNEDITDIYMAEDSGATVHAGMLALNMVNEPTNNPTPGTIRWNGSDFQGWNGVTWISLTGGAKVGELTDHQGNT